MKRTTFCTTAFIAFLSGITSYPGPVGVVPGRILIKPRIPNHPEIVENACRAFSGIKEDEIGGLGVHVFRIPQHAWQQALDGLKRHPDIEFAEPDYILEPDAVPNDPSYPDEWHLSKIQANTAWDKTTGSPNIIIAILDTGVDSTHPDLASKLVAGWNFFDNNANTADVYGHGTAVAGTAAAASNNGIGVTGVAWGCKIMPIRISDANGMAYDTTIAKALTWAADHGARVANISFGAADSSTVQSAAQYFQNKGGVVTISAGNDGTFDSAADNAYVLKVSATDSNDVLASFSSTGNNIDLAAPGVNIMTTVRGGGYGGWSGTSFAAPIVAGTAALVLSANPSLTGSQVRDILKQSADDLGATGFDTQYGFGRVNANRAVSSALNLLPSPPVIPPPVTGSTQEAILGRSGGTLRNDYTGTVGFRFFAGEDATITDLGRWVVAGNSGTHTVQLLDSSLTIVASINLSTAGATAGQFLYGRLSSPVSLIAGRAYFLTSSETTGGDAWYDYNQTITENLSIVSQIRSTWGAGLLGGGKSYVPVSFKFTLPTVAQEGILGRAGGTLRNSYAGPVGFKFVAAANATVTHLGRWIVAGNSGAHALQLVNASHAVLGSVTADTSTAAAGGFAYYALSSPISLVAGQTYFITSNETNGGDFWYDFDQTVTENAAIVSQMQSTYSTSLLLGGGKSYVPVSFKATLP